MSLMSLLTHSREPSAKKLEQINDKISELEEANTGIAELLHEIETKPLEYYIMHYTCRMERIDEILPSSREAATLKNKQRELQNDYATNALAIEILTKERSALNAACVSVSQ